MKGFNWTHHITCTKIYYILLVHLVLCGLIEISLDKKKFLNTVRANNVVMLVFNIKANLEWYVRNFGETFVFHFEVELLDEGVTKLTTNVASK